MSIIEEFSDLMSLVDGRARETNDLTSSDSDDQSLHARKSNPQSQPQIQVEESQSKLINFV